MARPNIKQWTLRNCAHCSQLIANCPRRTPTFLSAEVSVLRLVVIYQRLRECDSAYATQRTEELLMDQSHQFTPERTAMLRGSDVAHSSLLIAN